MKTFNLAIKVEDDVEEKNNKQKTYNSRDEFLNDDGMTEQEKIELTELIFKELQEQEEEIEREM